MPRDGLAALLGYAIGTAQILVLDWFRARWAHGRQLRLLRADLRRVAEFRATFNLRLDVPPESDQLPRPATLSPAFLSTVASVDFWITDEHRDDNTQQALLGVADGFAALSEIHARAMKELESLRSTTDIDQQKTRLERLVAYGADYDNQINVVHYTVRDALRDVERRLKTLRWWRQLPRLVLPMPKGTNPPPLTPGDPRLNATRPKKRGRDA